MFAFRKTALLFGLLAAQAVTALSATATESAPGITRFNKPFNEYTWVTAHNGYLDDMRRQLDRGVRGFMLDLHGSNLMSGAYLCHTTAKGTCDARTDMTFSDALNKVFLPYLRGNPNAVVTLMLENHVSRDTLRDALAEVPGLGAWVFDHRKFADGDQWPTLGQIIGSGRRLIIMTDKEPGRYQVNGAIINVLKDSDVQAQNHWDLGITVAKHDWSCSSRWSHHRRSTGVNRWPALFVMNQFHAWGSSAAHAGDVDNNLTWLERRVDNHCAAAMGRRTAPNYLAIDFNQTGDAFAYAAALSQGGMYFYERNNADAGGDTSCVVPAGPNHSLGLPSRGCENDEIRSLKLRGIAKGTRISLYDSQSGGTNDDYTIIDIKRDIGFNEAVVVGSFEQSYENSDVKVLYNRNNGLDGKVSRIVTGRTPTDFSDAGVVLYEGNSASQNSLCTVSLAQSKSFNLSNGCRNDEARSAKILKAKAGTRFWLYGNKDQETNQGWVEVRVVSDITKPVVVNSFEKSYKNGTLEVTRGGSGSQLDGKVSSMKIQR